MATIVITENRCYRLDERRYKEWLDDYCENTPVDNIDADSIRESLYDAVTGWGRCEIEVDDDSDLDIGVEDVMERVDPDGTRAKRRELEQKLSLAIKQVNSLRDEIDKLNKEIEGTE